MKRTRTGDAGGARPGRAGAVYARACLVAATWAYAASALAALATVRVVGERWWGGTLLLFCPRWLYLAPAAALGVSSCLARRPSLLLAQAATALAVAGPLMGFAAPWGRVGGPPASGARVRVMTFNQHHDGYRAADLIRLIERYEVDVVCLQELVVEPTLDAYLARGWYRDRGRCIASRFPIVRQFEPALPDFADPALDRVLLRAPGGEEFAVALVHRPSMRPGFEALRARDLRGLARAVETRRRAMGTLVARLDEIGRVPTIVAGDFNTPADSSLFDALRGRFVVAFERAGWGYGYTWPARLPGIGIDHILAGPGWAVTGCWVGPDLGSDHRPMIAEVVRTPARPRGPAERGVSRGGTENPG